jgi:hypothetical protein
MFIGNSRQVYRQDGVLHQVSDRHASNSDRHHNHHDPTCCARLRSVASLHSESVRAQYSYSYWDPTCLHPNLLGRAIILHESKET